MLQPVRFGSISAHVSKNKYSVTFERIVAGGRSLKLSHLRGRSIDALRAVETFLVDDELSGVVSPWLPDHLRHRQFVLGLIGHYLRLAPTDRSSLKELTALIACKIPA